MSSRTGRPSSISPTAPGNVQSGSPIPTTAAFAALPAGTLDSLLKPENKAKLQAILKYHVVSGDVKAADVVKLSSANTLEGSAVAIAVAGGKVKVNQANVTATDIAASNGTIHVVDAVLLPPAG